MWFTPSNICTHQYLFLCFRSFIFDRYFWQCISRNWRIPQLTEAVWRIFTLVDYTITSSDNGLSPILQHVIGRTTDGHEGQPFEKSESKQCCFHSRQFTRSYVRYQLYWRGPNAVSAMWKSAYVIWNMNWELMLFVRLPVPFRLAAGTTIFM